MWGTGQIMRQSIENKFHIKSESGSILLIFIIGLAQLSALVILSSGYFNKAKKTISSVDAELEIENSDSMIISYFSDERVCTAHFLNKDLVLGDVELTSIKSMKTVGSDLVMDISPLAAINNNSKNLKIAKTSSTNVSKEFVTNLTYNYLPLKKSSVVELKVELNAEGKILKCRSNMNVTVDESKCDSFSKGKFIYSTNDKIPKVCDGTAWIPAYKNAGYFSFATDAKGDVGQCMNKNIYTGGCKCPSGFSSKLIYEFESQDCRGGYFNYGSGAGCGAKVMECYYES